MKVCVVLFQGFSIICYKSKLSLNRSSAQGLKCKTNMIPILMHQMRISTKDAQAKRVGNPKKDVCNCKRAE
jgi:hypothetical protein